MTAAEKTGRTFGGASRTITWWRDADYFMRPDDEAQDSNFETSASRPPLLPALPALDIATVVTAAPVGLIGEAISRVRRTLEQASAEYDVDIWVADLVGRGVTMVGELKSAASVELPRFATLWDDVSAQLRGQWEISSAAMSELAQVSLTIGSAMSEYREVLRRFVDDVAKPIGVAYSDRLADYPPLAADYEDIEVVLGTEEDLEPRHYTDEDHQVWRP